METLPPEIKMYIKKFIGHPTASLIKDYKFRKYKKKDLDKYEEWLDSWRDFRKSNYEVEYWSIQYHRCVTADIHNELLYGIVLNC